MFPGKFRLNTVLGTKVMDIALLSILCLITLQSALGAERCGYGMSNRTFPDLQALERHGKCIPFEYDRSISHQGTPCDVLYEQGVTYVYLSSRRAEGSLPRYIDIFDETNLFFNVSVPARCLTEARKVLCHYFLPTCGNMTTFEPPTSVCEDVCERLHNLCPLEFNQLSLYFKSNSKILAPLGVTMINCSNTGEYIDPLHHCCSDLNIDIPCTKLNSSGHLVPDHDGCTSPGTIITSSPSSTVELLPTDSATKDNEEFTIGIVVSLLILSIAITIVVVVILILVKRKRSLLTKKDISGDKYSTTSETRSTLKRYRSDIGHLPASLTIQQVARVTSGYIRQMASEELLIPANNLTLLDTIGQGEFGVVYRGNLTNWGAAREQSLVAVKTLKGIFGTNDLGNIMAESVKMAKFNHQNVMRLIGVCIDKGASPYIVMPYMVYGSLLSHLKKHRVDLTLASDQDQELITATQTKLLSMCFQVAKGMSYLAHEQFVHRDLAARNCMIDENFVIKVADFGLSEDIYARNYFRQSGLHNIEGEKSIKLPVKWMAIESLHDGIFTEKTDVWSYGVTMWEVFSLGKNPYPAVDPFSVIQFLDDGGRLGKPANAACSHDIYTLMCECWTEDPDKRPNFSNLVSTISGRLEEIGGYMDLRGNGSTKAPETTSLFLSYGQEQVPTVVVSSEKPH